MLAKLSEDRFMKLSTVYEDEQQAVEVRMKTIQQQLADQAKQTVNVGSFIQAAKRHVDFTELTPTLLNEMIEKIVIHEGDKSSGKRTQQVDIYYSFGMGKLNISE